MPLTLAEFLQLPRIPTEDYRITNPRVITRFEKFFVRGAEDECWPWQGALSESKENYLYGAFRLDGQVQRAHRVAYRIYVGPIPEGLSICHHCDNPPCVNYIKHLFVGSHHDNMFDAAVKGRLHGNSPRPAVFPSGRSK